MKKVFEYMEVEGVIVEDVMFKSFPTHAYKNKLKVFAGAVFIV